MNTILFLIFFPVFVAMGLLLIKKDAVRGAVMRISAGILMISAIMLVVQYLNKPDEYYSVNSELIGKCILMLDCIMAVYIIYLGMRYKKYIASLLAFVQAGGIIWYELFASHAGKETAQYLFIDKLTLIMVIIIAIVGGLICIFAVSYMKEYQHHHPEIKDRRSLYSAVLFFFLAAMFGIVFSNDLLWIYFFWEITTLCSFLLIGYTQTKEAVNNAFTALIMNLIGGLGFAGAILYFGVVYQMTNLRDILAAAPHATNFVIPALLLAIAGLSKSAQLPFSKWLLGAMVAPTPTSALLHSSTMVKAGVYLLIRISPLLVGNIAGSMVIYVGGLTFLLMSFIAVSQSDAKKVLAYSTMANLGLIVVCAGIGNYKAIWAGVMLIIFHAVSKSLMFLSVGATEHVIGSRDIEDMHGLIIKLPQMAFLMAVGIAGMFLAPFGMLISKWAALKAFIDSKNIIIILMLVYGSAATLFYWTKWLGKIASVVPKKERLNNTVKKDEWFSLAVHALLTISLCLLFPIISTHFIAPVLQSMFSISEINIISQGNQHLMIIMMAMILILPFGMYYLTPHKKTMPVYMSGINAGDNRSFEGSIADHKKMQLASWYMEGYFSEKILLPLGILLGSGLLIGVLAFVIGGMLR